MHPRPSSNTMDKSIKFVQINKGVSELSSRLDHINDIIEQHNPKVVVINELNSPSTDNVTRLQFPGFTLETDNLDIIDNTSRTGVLIHKDLHYSRRLDLETPGTSMIWIQFKYPGRKPPLLHAVYRQFQRLGVPGSINPVQQHFRWEQIVSKWEQALTEGKEIITMGDFNLNTLRWDVPQHQMSQYDRTKQPMISSLRDRILSQGSTILSHTPTKIPDNPDSPPSCLDLMIVTNIEKIASYQAGLPSFSDHMLQVLTRISKGVKITKKFARIRSYKDFSNTTYKQSIIDHPSYIETLYENDPELITKHIIKIIQDSFEPLAPIKVIQLSNKNSTKLSPDIRSVMVERDLAHLAFRDSKDPDDLRNYRNLRNTVNRMISLEKFQSKVKKIQEDDHKISDKWKKMKAETGQDSFQSPQLIIENHNHHTSHKEIAGSLNRQYVQSVRKLLNEIESVPVNPIENYRKLVQNKEEMSTFTFVQISMHQLRSTLKQMKSTGSMGEDDVSIRKIKQAQAELEPLILKLVNAVIRTTTYPDSLKTTKIVPIRKSSKSITSSEGWRPINVIAALSKIIERVLLGQILDHLQNNDLVPAQHHGSIRGKKHSDTYY